ncbi:hypothetical protein BgAZ_201740 [Babesia gibsoni]|uniref:Uncharacterized protein n=1 Tax=Babesia gibsoni TaxID=33632 RepID=A0AAD8PDD5_BABGI|nr:hypothetical protein BgAZ_201740 [Babesia gibsoni]
MAFVFKKMLKRRGTNGRGTPQKEKDKSPSQEESRKPEEQKKDNDVDERSTPTPKAQTAKKEKPVQETTVNAKPEPKVETKPEPKVEVKPEPKAEVRKVDEQREAGGNQRGNSVQQNKKRTFANKKGYNRSDSLNTVNKSSNRSSQEQTQDMNFYRYDSYRKRMDIDFEEEEDTVRTILRLHSTRFKEFSEAYKEQLSAGRKDVCEKSSTESTPSVHKDKRVNSSAPNTKYPKGGSSGNVPPAGNVAASPIIASAEPSKVNSSTGQHLTGRPIEQDGGSGHAVAQSTYDKVEGLDHASRHRRQDSAKQPFVDRKKKSQTDKSGAAWEERTFNNYGRYKNRYSQNHKRDAKKNKPQEG